MKSLFFCGQLLGSKRNRSNFIRVETLWSDEWLGASLKWQGLWVLSQGQQNQEWHEDKQTINQQVTGSMLRKKKSSKWQLQLSAPSDVHALAVMILLMHE